MISIKEMWTSPLCDLAQVQAECICICQWFFYDFNWKTVNFSNVWQGLSSSWTLLLMVFHDFNQRSVNFSIAWLSPSSGWMLLHLSMVFHDFNWTRPTPISRVQDKNNWTDLSPYCIFLSKIRLERNPKQTQTRLKPDSNQTQIRIKPDQNQTKTRPKSDLNQT